MIPLCIDVELCKIDWTAIAAIVSGAMVVLTFFSLVQNKHQLREMKRQWSEEHRANVVFKIKHIGYGIYRLVMENTGKETAKEIRFSLDSAFLNSVSLSSLRDYLSEIQNNSYQLLPGERISFEFAYNETVGGTGRIDGFTIRGKHYSYDELKACFATMSSTDCHIKGCFNGAYTIDQTVGLSNHYIEPLSVEEHLSLMYGELAQIRTAFQPSDYGDTLLTEISKIRKAIEQEKK